MPRHIVIVFHDFPIGGTERVAIAMARRWVAMGWRVTILCGTEAGPQRAMVDPAVRVVALDPPLARSLVSRLELGRRMAAMLPGLAADVIFIPGNFHLPLARAFARVAGRAVIVAKISNPLAPDGWLGWPVRWLSRRYAGCIDGVATMNSGLESELRALAPGLRLCTLHDPVEVAPHPERAPRAAGAPYRVLWAGRFEPQKDVPLALAVIARLRRQVPLRVTMLGGGAGLAAARRQVARPGMRDVVDLPGQVPAIDPWLAKADALLITSRYEGGPAVAVEALAHGVPVVSTDCSHFLHDVMTLPEAGRIVTSRDPGRLARALAEVLEAGAPDRAALAGLVARLEPEACARAYLDFFSEVIAARAA